MKIAWRINPCYLIHHLDMDFLVHFYGMRDFIIRLLVGLNLKSACNLSMIGLILWMMRVGYPENNQEGLRLDLMPLTIYNRIRESRILRHSSLILTSY